MARTVIDQNMIIKINDAYLRLRTYAAVARELGISAGTVSKYVIKGYVPASEIKVKRFDYESYLKKEKQPFYIKEDLSNELILTEDEKVELKELWKELSV